MTNIFWAFKQELFLVGLPTLLVFILTFINRNTKGIISRSLGYHAQLYLGLFGIVMHESSHYFFAKLFHHQIVRFKPIIFHPELENGTLGYVEERYDPHSFYQSLGTLFTGTGPIWGCSLAVYLILRFLLPKLNHELLKISQLLIKQDYPQAVGHFLQLQFFNINSLSNLFRILVIFAISVSIVIGGFDLSNNDLMNARPGFLLFCLLLFIILFFIKSSGSLMAVIAYLNHLLLVFISLLNLSLLLSILVNLIVRIIGFFASFGY